MTTFRVQKHAGRRLDETYVYTRVNWGEEQAARYIRSLLGAPQGLFARPRFAGQIMNTGHAVDRSRAPGSFSAR